MKQSLPAIQSQKFSQNEIQLLRDTYAKGLDDTQLKIFLKQAEAMDLDPFKKEIYAMVVNGRLVLITSIEGRRKAAHKTGKYLGCKVTVQTDESGKIFSASAVVKKLVYNHVAEFEATVLFGEFDTGRDNWKTKPRVMISKVAESTALRMSFPSLDNAYDEAEAEAIHAIQDVVPVDEVINYENISQEPDPGEFMVNFGSRKNKPCKLREIPKTELEEFLAWAYTQEKLAEPIQNYVHSAEKHLERIQTQG